MDNRRNSRFEYEKAVLKRRRAEVRRQKLILSGVIITAILFITFTAGARITFAMNGGNNIRRVKQYRSVMINCGDTLTSIASSSYSDDFKDIEFFMHEINMINHLDEDEELIAGNYLTIPYYIDSRDE